MDSHKNMAKQFEVLSDKDQQFDIYIYYVA